MPEKKRVALYARVSKDEASKEGKMQDPENQLIPMRKYCEALGWEIEGEYIDWETGKFMERERFDILLRDARQKKFDLVLVWALDRFSRAGIWETADTLKVLKENKVALKSLQESWVDTSSEGIGEVMIALMLWFAKQERVKISDRTKAGLVRIRAEGKHVGRPPFGFRYDFEKERLVEMPEELEVVRKALRMASDGMPINSIADRLKLDKSFVKRMLKNKTYQSLRLETK